MSDPEKRKRLEAIRQKKEQLKKELEASKLKKEQPNQKEKSIDIIAKEALEASKVISTPFDKTNVEESKKIIAEMNKRKILQSLSIQSQHQFYNNSKPDYYDEGTQYYEQKDNIDDQENSDNEEIEKIQKKPHIPLILHKAILKEENDDTFDFREKTYGLIPKEQKKEILEKRSEELSNFLQKQKKITEKSINEDNIYNILLKGDSIFENNPSEKTKELITFFDSNCVNRTINSLQWSLKYNELLLSSYTKPTEILTEKNGLINLWSLALRDYPEFTLTCQAEITSSIFHTYTPKLIIGGTFTGQVLLWDTRGNENPIMKTPLGIIENIHNSPIVGLGVVGTTISNQIISVSNGMICLWSLSNLNKPIKKIELNNNEENIQVKEIGVLCMGMQNFENNNLLVGSDDYNIYQISLHASENEDNNKNLVASFKGHEGPIYSVTPHPGDPFNTYNFSSLFLSSSADWTTRLWTKNQDNSPLITIDNNEDSIYCSKWCPTNASVFSCSDGRGNIDFYNLNKDLEVPIYKMNIGEDVINNLSWSYDGKRIATGDSGGKVKVFEISKDIYRGTQEDSMKFDKIISSIKLNK